MSSPLAPLGERGPGVRGVDETARRIRDRNYEMQYLVKSSTGGEKSGLPANHGFAVY